MPVLQNKIDFVAVISCKNANPNGDPLNGNQPRTTLDGRGEISDVAIKRKIRNRLLDMGEPIFVQSDDKRTDDCKSLRERADANIALKEAAKTKDKDQYARAACQAWADVRAFGQVFAFSSGEKDGLSVGVRGPVSIHPAFSIDPVDITSSQITKSVNSETKDKKSSDTMGMKHRVDFGVYVIKGSINVQLAEKTGFTEADAELLREALRTLFVNDSSSARPDGSMTVEKLFWWRHNSKLGQYTSAKVHGLVSVAKKENIAFAKDFGDYAMTVGTLDGLACEEYDGL